MTKQKAYIRAAYNALIERDLLIKEPVNEYNANRKIYLTSGGLKIARTKSLADFHYEQQNPEDSDKACYLEGRASHALILEGPEEFFAHYRSGAPINKKTGKEFSIGTIAFEDARKQCLRETGKELITRSMHENIIKMRNSCEVHPVISDILSSGMPEVTIRVKYKGVYCQIRIDHLSPKYGICDLKTTLDIMRFEKDARYKYYYLFSAAFYRAVVKAAIPDFPEIPYCFIAVEKVGINKSGVFMVSEDELDFHEGKNIDLIKEIAKAQQSGKWPTGFERLKIIERETNDN